jgi:hypothetical protein
MGQYVCFLLLNQQFFPETVKEGEWEEGAEGWWMDWRPVIHG